MSAAKKKIKRTKKKLSKHTRRPNSSNIRIYMLFTRIPLKNKTDVLNFLSRKNIVKLNHVKNLDDLRYTMGKII